MLVREVIADTLRDNTGQMVYRIERFERENDTLPWKFTQNIFAARTAAQAIRTVKLWKNMLRKNNKF